MIPKVARGLSQFIAGSVVLPSSASSLGIDSLDNRIRDGLQRTSHEFFVWVLVSAAVVVVGVALEGPEILHEIWPGLFSWFTWNSRARLDKFGRRIKNIGLLGWLLVVVGVMGEGVFEGLQNRAEDQLQTFNDILLTDARLTASTAKSSASEAASAADRANKSSDAAIKNSEIAESDVDALSRKASNLSNGLRDADSQMALLDGKRKALEAELVNFAVCTAPRVIGIRYLGPKSNVDPLRIYSGSTALLATVSDPEAIRAFENIARALQEAGWRVIPVPPPSDVLTLDDGVVIESTSASQEKGEAVRRFLKSYNWQADRLDAWSGHRSLIPDGAILIEVGLYPAQRLIIPPAEKGLEAAASENDKKREEMRESARLSHQKDITKGWTQEQLDNNKRMREQRLQSTEQIMQDFAQPCRPMKMPDVQP